jgi:hypothetical protein
MQTFQLVIMVGRIGSDPRLIPWGAGDQAAHVWITVQSFTLEHGRPRHQTVGLDVYVVGGARARQVQQRWRTGMGVMLMGRLIAIEAGERRVALEVDHMVEAPPAGAGDPDPPLAGATPARPSGWDAVRTAVPVTAPSPYGALDWAALLMEPGAAPERGGRGDGSINGR